MLEENQFKQSYSDQKMSVSLGMHLMDLLSYFFYKKIYIYISEKQIHSYTYIENSTNKYVNSTYVIYSIQHTDIPYLFPDNTIWRPQ